MDVRVSLVSALLSSIKTYLFHYFKANEVLRIRFTDRRWAGGGNIPLFGLFSDLVSCHYQTPAPHARVSTKLNPLRYLVLHFTSSHFLTLNFLVCRPEVGKLLAVGAAPFSRWDYPECIAHCINTMERTPAPARPGRHVLLFQ